MKDESGKRKEERGKRKEERGKRILFRHRLVDDNRGSAAFIIFFN